jgi:hypothetical protein
MSSLSTLTAAFARGLALVLDIQDAKNNAIPTANAENNGFELAISNLLPIATTHG